MVLLSQNNVLRVKELVSAALKHNRSINFIVDKVGLAIHKVYRARRTRRRRTARRARRTRRDEGRSEVEDAARTDGCCQGSAKVTH